MSKLLEHAEQELKYAGYDITRGNYTDECAKNALDMLKVFCKAGHSGMSASVTLNIFNKLANWKNLIPLTNNPDEWQKLGGEDDDLQNKRNPSCFTSDLKTYWDISEECNKVRSPEGNSFHMKPKSEWVKHKLKDYKEGK